MQTPDSPASNLKGVRVLITRPVGGGQEEWNTAFAKRGAIPVAYPTVEIQPPSSWIPADLAIARIASFDWLVFTSATAVRFFVPRIPSCTLAHAPRIAAIGPRTAESVGQAGGQCALVASDSRQEGLLELLKPLAPQTRILLPQAEQGRPFLTLALRERQCEVCVVPVYRTVPLVALPATPEFDVAIFASSSAFQAFLAQNTMASLYGKPIVAIGPTTAESIRRVGFSPLVASKPTLDVLVEMVALSRQQHGEP